VCLILVLYVLYIPMFHLRDSGVKFSLSVFICLRERGELNQREGKRDNSSQRWVENTNMTDCLYLQSINSDKQLPPSTFTGQHF
jgi:hypothetical protein